MELKYGFMDGDSAVIYNDKEAWKFVGGNWKKIDTADAFHKAKMLSKAEYDKLFASDHLPALPVIAFR